MFLYFNNAQFEEINASNTTRENGKVFINHPYIITVRKAINAYCAGDLNALAGFFTPGATFSNSTMKWGETMDVAKWKQGLADQLNMVQNVSLKQVGYPDCIYYEKNDAYVVYSWWVWSAINKADGKKIEFPIMLAHSFNKDGKIVSEEAYYSSNHFTK